PKAEDRSFDDSIRFSFPFPLRCMVVIDQLLQRVDQNRARHAKLLQTLLDRARQNAFAISRQLHEHVRPYTRASDETVRLGTIYEFHCAVMTASQVLR